MNCLGTDERHSAFDRRGPRLCRSVLVANLNPAPQDLHGNVNWTYLHGDVTLLQTLGVVQRSGGRHESIMQSSTRVIFFSPLYQRFLSGFPQAGSQDAIFGVCISRENRNIRTCWINMLLWRLIGSLRVVNSRITRREKDFKKFLSQ